MKKVLMVLSLGLVASGLQACIQTFVNQTSYPATVRAYFEGSTSPPLKIPPTSRRRIRSRSHFVRATIIVSSGEGYPLVTAAVQGKRDMRPGSCSDNTYYMKQEWRASGLPIVTVTKG